MSDLDGNVLAGLLSDVFAVDVTRLPGRCARCGECTVSAEARVYVSAMGSIAWCRRCSNVLMSLVDAPGTRSVSLSGLALVQIDRNEG